MLGALLNDKGDITKQRPMALNNHHGAFAIYLIHNRGRAIFVSFLFLDILQHKIDNYLSFFVSRSKGALSAMSAYIQRGRNYSICEIRLFLLNTWSKLTYINYNIKLFSCNKNV